MPTVDPDCVFCKIVAGKIPSLTVMDTPHALAFLDIGPLAESHLLVIPKNHYARLDEMPEQEAGELAKLLPGLSRAVCAVSGAGGYNILQNNGQVAGQVVQHVHFHIIPRVEGDELGYRWLPQEYSTGRAEQIRNQLLQALKSTD